MLPGVRREIVRHLIAGVLVLIAAPAFAQSETVRIGEPFSVVADHDGVNTSEYLIETLAPGLTAPVITDRRPVSALVNGAITFSLPAGLPATAPVGTYQVQIVAVGPNGTARSPILQFVVEPAASTPVAPGMPRILRP